MAKVLDKRVVDRSLDVACDGATEPEKSAPRAAAEIATRRVATTRFGMVEVDMDLVVTFRDGLIGFEACQEFVVVRNDDNSAFRWLQSLDEPAVAFPIVEPSAFRPDYAPTISDSDARLLSLKRETAALLFVVVSVPGHDPRAMTANLLAPLVINGETRQGKQVIVLDDGFTTRHEVVKELARTAALTTAGSSEGVGAAPQEAAGTVRAA